jgi:hypothetical protein
LGLGPFQDDDGAEESFPDFPLTVDQLGSARVEFRQLAGAFLQLLLLPLEKKQLLLALLELLSNMLHRAAGTHGETGLLFGRGGARSAQGMTMTVPIF